MTARRPTVVEDVARSDLPAAGAARSARVLRSIP